MFWRDTLIYTARVANLLRSLRVASNALEETLLTGVNEDYCCVRTVFHLLHGYMLSSCGVVYSLPKSEILNAKGYCFCGGPYYVR